MDTDSVKALTNHLSPRLQGFTISDLIYDFRHMVRELSVKCTMHTNDELYQDVRHVPTYFARYRGHESLHGAHVPLKRVSIDPAEDLLVCIGGPGT